jgi:hypothetical protein
VSATTLPASRVIVLVHCTSALLLMPAAGRVLLGELGVAYYTLNQIPKR